MNLMAATLFACNCSYFVHIDFYLASETFSCFVPRWTKKTIGAKSFIFNIKFCYGEQDS